MIDDLASHVNALPTGWVREMGITILAATPDEVSCEWEVTEKHHQGYGIVHGGVHCGVIETLASLGAAIVARPVTRGRTTQVWEASIRDEEGRLVAEGRVRLLCLDEGREL